jgi:hypothetical protein
MFPSKQSLVFESQQERSLYLHEHRPKPDPPESIQSYGSLYKHDVCKPTTWIMEWIKLKIRPFIFILSLAYKYGLKMDYRVQRYTPDFLPHYLRL